MPQACSRQSRIHIQGMPVLVNRFESSLHANGEGLAATRLLTITAFHCGLLEARYDLVRPRDLPRLKTISAIPPQHGHGLSSHQVN